MEARLTPVALIEEQVKTFYTTEGADPLSYSKLTNEEKSNLLYEFGYATFSKTEQVSKFLSAKLKDALDDKRNRDFKASQLYRDIAKSGGDISLIKEIRDTEALMEYVLSSNQMIKIDPKGQQAASAKAQQILNAIKARKRMKETLRKILSREASTATVKVFHNYYIMTTLYLLAIADAFYGDAIKADIDYTTQKSPVVKSLYFTIDDSKYDVENGIIDVVTNEYKYVKANAKDQSLITESFESIHSNVLQEGVFDVVFAMVSQNKLLDATLLLPIYVVRSLIYAFFFLKETLNRLSDDLDEAINMRRKQTVLASEFSTYKSKVAGRQFEVNQSLQKGAMNIRYELEEDRKVISGQQLVKNIL